MAGSHSVEPPHTGKNTKRVLYIKLYTIICIYLNVTCGRGAVVQKHSLGSKISSDLLYMKLSPSP